MRYLSYSRAKKNVEKGWNMQESISLMILNVFANNNLLNLSMMSFFAWSTFL